MSISIKVWYKELKDKCGNKCGGMKVFFIPQALCRTTRLLSLECQWVIHLAPRDYIQAFSSPASILSVPLAFFLVLRLSSSLVQQLWSRVRVKGISHTPTVARTHTHKDCATVRLECSWGCGGTGLDFPMPIVNCWLYLKLRGDLRCPLDPSPGPWPRGYASPPAGTLNGLYVCVRCVC